VFRHVRELKIQRKNPGSALQNQRTSAYSGCFRGPKKKQKNQNQRTGGFHERTIEKKQPF
jgi:hypothetical protein